MAVDEAEFEQCVGTAPDRFVPHPGELRDVAAVHRQLAVEHREGDGDGSSTPGDRLDFVLEAVDVLDPPEHLDRERRGGHQANAPSRSDGHALRPAGDAEAIGIAAGGGGVAGGWSLPSFAIHQPGPCGASDIVRV